MMFPHFYRFILYPNKFTTFLGGDAFIIYHQMIYHTKYGSGTHLESMNYPSGEFLWMTDGSGSFALLFKWFSKYIYDISDIIPGVYTYIILISWLIAMVIMYYLLLAFDVKRWIAILASPTIILLSPMIIRFMHHMSQPFPLLIPLAILWLVRKTRIQRLEKRDILLWIVFVFFFLNNSYSGAIALGIGLSGAVFYMLLNKDKSTSRSVFLTYLLPVLSVVITVLAVIKLGDIYDDRLKVQWGFFDYNAEISGYFYPMYSLLRDFLNGFVKVADQGYEQAMNLGIIPALFLIYYMVKLAFKKAPFKLGKMHAALFLGAFSMFLFAANSNYFPFLQSFMENYTPMLTMFKASARFGWPMYFVVAILACRFITYIFDLWKEKPTAIRYGVPLLILSLWYLESNYFLNQSVMETRYGSPFQSDFAKKVYHVSDSLSIDTTHYQAMFMLPHIQAWHDNLYTHKNYYSEITGMLISEHTGIPWINSNLSRNSTGVTYRSTQMVSSGMIQREIIDILPNDKDILLIEGREERPLVHGEKYLKSLATQIYHDGDITLYELPIKQLKEAKYYNDIKDQLHGKGFSAPKYPYIIEHFDQEVDPTFYGSKGELVKRGQNEFFRELEITVPEDGYYEIGIWVYEDGIRWGTLDWKLYIENGDYKKEVTVITRECRDVFGTWMRANKEFFLPKGENKIEMRYFTRKDIRVDEMLIRHVKDTIVYDLPTESTTLVNGFKIEK